MKKDCIIIGGGIVGLASGYELLKKNPGLSLTILEKEPEPAIHQTGHNSGVIHSGIYYKPGSLKAKNCRRGVELLLSFCREQNIPYTLCGKVIVATSENEIPMLDSLYHRGMANGVPGLKKLSKEALNEIEPHAAGIRAIHSPETGIIDYTEVAHRLAQCLREKGAVIVTGAKALHIDTRYDGLMVETTAGDFSSHKLINCAGLFSDKVAELAGVNPRLKIVPFRGEYYVLKDNSKYLVNSLIYPVPDPRFPFLGVHFTTGMDGSVEAGPNAVLALAREGYRKSDIKFRDIKDYMMYSGFWSMAGKYWKTAMGEYYRSFYKPAFVKALQKLVPELKSTDLSSGGSGVRAQALMPHGQLVDDFSIIQKKNMVHVLNTPSPAATSALSIGEYISGLVASA